MSDLLLDYEILSGRGGSQVPSEGYHQEQCVQGSNYTRRVMGRILPGSAEAYALATLFVVVAGLLRWGLGLFTDDVQAFTTFYPAVLFATLLGGAGVGTFAAVLTGVISWWKFLSPHSAALSLSLAEEINLLTFVFASVLIVWAVDHYRKLSTRLEEEEKLRKLAVEELAHRLKNKVATIQAIISLRLREDPAARNEILSSLSALMGTDELIIATQGQGAHIRDILATELTPYGVSQISLDGPNCLLSPKLAMTMALLIHELATNAAKYGALSSSGGKLSISWSLSDARLNLEWREMGGPITSQPTHQGFGTRLFSRALEPFGGTVEANFETAGLTCKLSMALSNSTSAILPDVTGQNTKVFAAE
jgi:two-component sensor histidine kinase